MFLSSYRIDLTEFWNGPMLAPRLREVHVREASKNLTIAVLMTIADAAVVVWYGGVIWQALSPIIWSRILILPLAALWGLSLARVWARAIYSLRRRPRSRNFAAIPSIDLRREGDV
jgi:ABC-type bacteriocin/lantibiotic exporter with double-glycine peptidase domain